MVEEDALSVVVIDDERIPTARRFSSAAIADPGAWASDLERIEPDIAYVPNLATTAQLRLALALAERGVRVVVGASREAFLTMAADPTLQARLW